MALEYLLVLALTILVPALRARDPNVPLSRRRRDVLLTLLIVVPPYWLWDCIATARGHWSFNPEFVIGIRMFGLPVEEFLFFPVVVFVAIFVWENTKFFWRKD
jgi:lycopene cyclase domain-containing protein